ncbi:MAG: hypothetical protein ACRD1N_07755 [Terriglobia bacterium]
MRTRVLCACCAIVSLVVLGSGSLRASQVTLTINNAGSNTMGGVYVGPYNFTLSANGQNSSAGLICDDANDDVHPPGEYWNAATESYSNLPSSLDGALFPKGNVNAPNVVGYEEVGYLAEQMLANLSNTTEVGELQWAIWDIFDAGTCGTGISNCDPFGSLTSTQLNAVNSYLSGAASNYASGNYSNLVIYTPVAGSQVPRGDGLPQEYIGTAAEPSTVVLLGLVLIGALGLGKRFCEA